VFLSRGVLAGSGHLALSLEEFARMEWYLLLLLVVGKILATSITLNADRKSTRLNSSHVKISYAVLCLKKKHSRVRPRRGRGVCAPRRCPGPEGSGPCEALRGGT